MQSRRLGVQQLVCVAAPLALLLLLLVAGTQVVVVEGAGVNKEVWGSMSSKLSGIIIPGFVSSQLRAWAILDCPYTPLDFRPLDPVWLDTKKVRRTHKTLSLSLSHSILLSLRKIIELKKKLRYCCC
jgi:hypothetical protein